MSIQYSIVILSSILNNWVIHQYFLNDPFQTSTNFFHPKL